MKRWNIPRCLTLVLLGKQCCRAAVEEPLLSHRSLCSYAEGRLGGSDKGRAATIPHPDQGRPRGRSNHSGGTHTEQWRRQGHQPQTPDGLARPPSSHPTVEPFRKWCCFDLDLAWFLQIGSEIPGGTIGEFESLILSLPPSFWDCGYCLPHLALWNAGDQTQPYTGALPIKLSP